MNLKYDDVCVGLSMSFSTLSIAILRCFYGIAGEQDKDLMQTEELYKSDNRI